MPTWRRYRKSDPRFLRPEHTGDQQRRQDRDASTSPKTVKRGQMVSRRPTIRWHAAQLFGCQRGRELVTEEDGKVLTTVKSDPQQRVGGGWDTEAGFPVPETAETGTYIVEHKVKVGTVTDTP